MHKRRQVFALFKSIFLRNQSFSNARWFYGFKNPANWEGNLYLTENWLSRNEMWCVADNHNYMCHICAKGFLDSNFNKSNFQEIAQNFTYLRKSQYFKGQRYIASVCHIISLIEFRKPFTQSKCINCIGIQNNNILKKLFHVFIQTVILKLAMLNYG